jgi:hypothetical protein
MTNVLEVDTTNFTEQLVFVGLKGTHTKRTIGHYFSARDKLEVE